MAVLRSWKSHSVLPDFGLALGFTILYLSLIAASLDYAGRTVIPMFKLRP